MYDRRFGLGEVTEARFAISPLWELAASLRVLGQQSGGVHRVWVARTRTALRDARVDLSRLRALVPATGHLADFLTPPPPRRVNDVEDELHRLAATPPSAVRRDLDLLAGGARGGSARVLAEARADPERFTARVADELARYWRMAVAPSWPRLRGMAEADIAWRLESIADHGTRTALGTLHDRVRSTDAHLIVRGTCDTGDRARPGAGVVLVPCAFTWPNILLLDSPTGTPTLSYSARGVGTLWQNDSEHPAALAELIGRTRAVLLRMLDLPATTTQLAGQLGLTEPTTNAHLQILHRSGMVTRRRSGKFVYYQRTALGAGLLVARGHQTPR
jgi:DNA-binding transcriptional ArsR family regulator